MEMTLNQYLSEVDRWKQAVSDEMAKLDPANRARRDEEAIAWLEAKLGRRMRRAGHPGTRDANGDDGVRGSE